MASTSRCARRCDRVRSARHGHGLRHRRVDHDPGQHGGKTTITMNDYHAPGAGKTPTQKYELFETVTLSKHRRG
jgi:hypothetical protein